MTKTYPKGVLRRIIKTHEPHHNLSKTADVLVSPSNYVILNNRSTWTMCCSSKNLWRRPIFLPEKWGIPKLEGFMWNEILEYSPWLTVNDEENAEKVPRVIEWNWMEEFSMELVDIPDGDVWLYIWAVLEWNRSSSLRSTIIIWTVCNVEILCRPWLHNFAVFWQALQLVCEVESVQNGRKHATLPAQRSLLISNRRIVSIRSESVIPRNRLC